MIGGNARTHHHEPGAARQLGERRRRRGLDELDVEVGGPLAHGLVSTIVDGYHPYVVFQQPPGHRLAAECEADHERTGAGRGGLWTPPARRQLTNPRERKSA